MVQISQSFLEQQRLKVNTRWATTPTRPKISLFDPPSSVKKLQEGGGDNSVLWSSVTHDWTSRIDLMGGCCMVCRTKSTAALIKALRHTMSGALIVLGQCRPDLVRMSMTSKIWWGLFLSKDTSLWWNFHEDPVNSFYMKLLADIQTDRQTDKRRALHNLVGGGKNYNNNYYYERICLQCHKS